MMIKIVQPIPQNTFFENAINAGLNSIFTADLKKGIPGSYDFGFIDNSKFKGEITYVP
jgi:aspergillopepsin I